MAKAPTKTDDKTAEETVVNNITEKQEVATTQGAAGTDVSTEVNYDFAADAGATQDMAATDLKLPFIKIVQDLTPEANKKLPTYVEGCESGMMMDSNSGELISGETGILFVPFAFTHDVTEWKPKRGGLAALHGKDESLFKTTRRNDQNEDILPNGNSLLLSYVYYGLRIIEDEQAVAPVVLAWSKTALKHARAWNTTLSTGRVKWQGKVFVPAYYFNTYRITTTIETDGGTNAWYVPKPRLAGPTVELGKQFPLLNGLEVYNEAKKMREMWDAGNVQADMSQMANQTQEGASGPIPF